jgi:DinB superfamily
MKTTLWLLAMSALCSLTALAADQPPSAGKIVENAVSNAEKDIVGMAEAMPADKFDFAPTHGEFKGVRTFGQQIKHVAAVNYLVAAALLQQKPPVDLGKGENGPDSMAGKDEIVKFLKDSFAYVHKAEATLTDANLNEMIKGPFGERKSPRLGLAMIPAWHTFDHYGQMVVYGRMNGIIPPASRR